MKPHLDLQHSIHPGTQILADAMRSAAEHDVEIDVRKMAMAIGVHVDIEAAYVLGLGRVPVLTLRSRVGYVPFQECDTAMVRTECPQLCAAYLILLERVGRIPTLETMHREPVTIDALHRIVEGAVEGGYWSFYEPWMSNATVKREEPFHP